MTKTHRCASLQCMSSGQGWTTRLSQHVYRPTSTTPTPQLQLAAPEDAVALASPLLTDPSSPVRAAALETLGASGHEHAIAPALESLRDDDPLVRTAAVEALARLDLRGYEGRLREFAEARVSLAAEDRSLAAAIPANGEATGLLRDALMDRGRKHAITAVSVLALLSQDRVP